MRVVPIVWLAVTAALACTPAWAGPRHGGSPPPRARAAHTHFACSGPNAAHVPCRFSTPSGNVRCEWTPARDTVVCELLATHRAYRLRPNGHAARVHVHLTRRGQTLPTNQQLIFPKQLSCHDTRTTMTCNQDFLSGEFKLAPQGSHSA